MDESERRATSWNMAVFAEATRFVFEKRYRKLRRWTRARDYLAIAVPIGLAYLASSDLFDFLKPFKTYATATLAALASVQILLALWSLISRWDEDLADYKTSSRNNYAIKEDWKRIANNDSSDPRLMFDHLTSQQRVLDDRDVEKMVTQKEKQKGMRDALIEFQRPCVCNNIPNGLKLPWWPKQPCGVCGGN